jgi:phosphohistidine phosphatase
LLLRHAKSSPADPGSKDFDRPLTGWGVRAAREMGRYLAGEGTTPDLILCSAARRGRQTLALLLPAVAHEPRICIEKDLYMASGPWLLQRLRRIDRSVRGVLLQAGSRRGSPAFGPTSPPPPWRS